MKLQIPARGDIIRTKRTENIMNVKLTFWHWAVFVSPNEVIHYTSPKSDAGGDSMKIQPTDFEGFLKRNNHFEIVEFPSEYHAQKKYSQGVKSSNHVTKQLPISPLKWLLPGFLSIPMSVAKVAAKLNSFRYQLATPDQVVERARSRCGEQKYNFMLNNCEHFAVFCKTGVAESEQTALWKYLESINMKIDNVGKHSRSIHNLIM